MPNQKIENLLNISLEVDETERKKSPSLSTGFNPVLRTWEIIVRFTGNIEDLRTRFSDIEIKPLLNNYAILIVPENLIDRIANDQIIEYIEKPKSLYFQLVNGKAASCINQVQQGGDNSFNLFGSGVIVAIIDTGIDVLNREFRNEDGTSRILNIWDQTTGEMLDQSQINELISSGAQIDVGSDVIGHGTDVARIACGNSGVAPQADIVVVKMGLGSLDGFPRTTQLMEALDYVVRKGIQYGKPVAINISFGNNYGDHTGRSLLETFIDDISNVWKCAICIGAGNEGLGTTHTGGILSDDMENEIEIVVENYETSIDIQIWKDYWDDFGVEIITPAGVNLGVIRRINQVSSMNSGLTTVLTFYGEPSPYSARQEIYISMIPKTDASYIDSGIWRIRLIPERIVVGNFDMWLPAIGSLNEGTGFAKPDGSFSITIPATSSAAISVGAYDARLNTYASFSGRGYVTQVGSAVISKPDIVAPGVGVQIGVGKMVSGTSFATPFATGGAALMMEWGIVRGNDLFLYHAVIIGLSKKNLYLKGFCLVHFLFHQIFNI